MRIFLSLFRPIFLCRGGGGETIPSGLRRMAFLVGIVSRGTDCAALNSPGIYTKVTAHLEWIRSNIKDGECGG